MNEFIIEIEKNTKLLNIDKFKKPHTCIENPQVMNLEEDYDENNMKYDVTTGISFIPVDWPLYYQNDSCFESIYKFGKVMKDKTSDLGKKSISDYYYSIENKEELIKFIKEWLSVNEYPYYCKKYGYKLSETDKSLLFSFIDDSIELYVIHELHKLIVKVRRNIELISYQYGSSKSDNPELYKIIQLLKYIDIESYITLGTLYNDISQLEKDSINYELLNKGLNDFTEIIRGGKLNEFIELVNILLIGYVSMKIHSSIDYKVTKQVSIHRDNTNITRQFDCANSIMGIAYQKLHLNLTAQKTDTKEVCNNPMCTNEFDKKNKIHNTCDSCQNWRKNKSKANKSKGDNS